MEYYSTFELTEEFKSYERMVTDNFYAIERTGLQIDYNKFTEKFKANGIVNNKAYTEYNIWTTTGRPSNKFGGVNYAALNKEDGCRESFVSRFEQGSLLEMDFDAYHPRLIADIIKYKLHKNRHDYGVVSEGLVNINNMNKINSRDGFYIQSEDQINFNFLKSSEIILVDMPKII